jgi:hypothetical protein
MYIFMPHNLVSPQLSKVFKTSGVALLATFTTITIFHQPSYGDRILFSCKVTKNTPTTYVRTSLGQEIPIIRWVQNFFPGITPLERCRQVSRKFQVNADQGFLKTITTGKINGYPVVCAAKSTNDSCTSQTVLFTLKPGTNPKIAVERLLDRRGLAAGKVSNQSSDDNQIYVDFETYLYNIPPES